MNQVAFIGAGNIGAPMARTLLQGKFAVKVCDFSEQARRHFDALGCETTDKASAVADCPVVVIMVNTAEQFLDTLFGPDGLVAGLRDDVRPLVIVTSTILPAIIEDASARLAGFGLTMVDAPVSGGPIPAAEGTLTIMVGGDPADIARALPILNQLGSRVTVCGPLGAGQKSKIINNLLGVTNQLLMGEALELAARCGLDGECLLSVIDNSSGRNFWSRDWDLTRRQYAEYAQVADDGAYVQRSIKDLELARRLAEAGGIGLPVLGSVMEAVGRSQDPEMARRFRSVARIQPD